ncbi:MAG: DNA cytosine methyltransferase [Clostridia bacterium]|nr:DNA cytosine methyltransferase [Clostridia bacterium]
MIQDNLFRELIVDNFAGGGGASVGIELATGRPVDIAINHDPDAIAMHDVNHPYTMHYIEDVFAIDPVEVTGGRPVGIAWFSPDCKHFSRAKGGTPVEHKVRGLSWVILKWALSGASPRVVFMENVEEIQTWGPLMEIKNQFGKREWYPDPARKGETFQGFVSMLTTGIEQGHPAWIEACEFLEISTDSADAKRLLAGLGYDLEFRELRACDYGAPTIRKRFYMVARRDGQPIVWPKPTHGKGKGLKPYRTAAECIDWSIPCPSIFNRKKPLVPNTLRRVAFGINKFVLKNPKPFIVQLNYKNTPQEADRPMTTQTTAGHHYVCAPAISKYFGGVVGSRADDPMPTVTAVDHNALLAPQLVTIGYGEKEGQTPRVKSIESPCHTIPAGGNKHFISAPYLIQYYHHNQASGADAPLHTVTTKDRSAFVEAHMTVFRRNVDAKPLDEPMPTLTTSAGHMAVTETLLVKYDPTVNLLNWPQVRELLNTYGGWSIDDDEILLLRLGDMYVFIGDIGLRMMKAEELKLAQGFPVDYCIDIESKIGRKYSEAKQIARLGNAVCPPVATALIRANCPDMAYKKALHTVAELESVIV